MRLRWQPAVRVAPPYYDDPVYIDALADSIRAHLATVGFEPEALIASFHGMPQRYLEAGDPYHCQCQKTARLLREQLGWPSERWHTTFQSRFGNEPWLQPYTIEEVERLARSGVKRLAIVAPGFSVDCLETLEELDMENRAVFLANGGEKFAYVPCLNDGELGMRVIEHRRAARADGVGMTAGQSAASRDIFRSSLRKTASAIIAPNVSRYLDVS